MTTNFFSPLSFVAVFGSGIRDGPGIRDKHPGSATLHYIIYYIMYVFQGPPARLAGTEQGSSTRERAHSGNRRSF
jgi:hypothetical protein